MQRFHPHAGRRIMRDTGRNLFIRHAVVRADRRGCKRRINQVSSRCRNVNVIGSRGCHRRKHQLFRKRVPDVDRAEIAVLRFSDKDEMEAALFFRILPEFYKELIVPVHDCETAVRKTVKDLAFCLENVLFTAEISDMCLTDIRDRADIGLCDSRQIINLAAVVHAHLQNRDLRIRADRKDGSGQSYIVVEIRLRLDDVEPFGEDGGDHVFGRCFADTSCHRNRGNGKAAPVISREIPRRANRVLCQNIELPLHIGAGVLRNNTARGTGRKRCRNVFMSVAFFSGIGEKDIAVLYLPVIRDSAGDHDALVRAGTQELPSDRADKLAKRNSFHQSPLLRSASFMMISHSSSYEMPTAAASCGTRLVGVMPGSVFTSRKYILSF